MFHKSSLIKQVIVRFIIALLVLIPIGIVLLALSRANLRQFHWLYPSLWQAPNLILAIAIGCVLIVFAIYAVLNRRPGIFLIALFVLLSSSIYHSYNNFSSKDMDYLSIGQYPPFHGVEVYCNDVYLGKTPLLISKEEFIEKVPKWETPPAQPIIEPLYREPFPRKEKFKFGSVRYYYFPDNPFDVHKSNFTRNGSNSWQDRFLDTRYFWHFEQNGCTGLVNNDIFTNASGDRNTVYSGNPQIYFPALKPLVQTLLLDLRTNDSQPSAEWVQFVESRLDWLFYVLLKHSEAQSGVMKAIENRYRIPETVQPQEAARIVKEVIQSVEEQEGFSIPSPESKALDRVAAVAHDVLVELYPHYIKQPVAGIVSSGPSNGILTLSYGDVSNGKLPLEYLIRRTKPKELIDDLLYAYNQSKFGSDRFSALLSHYDHSKIQDFITSHFKDEKSGYVNWILYDFSNPRVQWAYEQAIQKNTYSTRSYLDAVMNDPSLIPEAKADKIYSRINNSPSTLYNINEQLEYLIHIPAKRVHSMLMNMHVDEVSEYQEVVLSSLIQKPNPFLDQFLLDLWASGERNNFDRIQRTLLIQAMLSCQTEKTKELLNNKWDEDPKIRKEILSCLANTNYPSLKMEVWLEKIDQLNDIVLKQLAVPFLSKLNTPRAMSILQKWVESDHERVIDTFIQALEEYNRRIAATSDLLSGKIKPDDLLPPPVAYVWKEGEYVEAEQATAPTP